MGIETLYDNEWVSLRRITLPGEADDGVNGYVYSHETRCAGRIVSVLPYLITLPGLRFLLREEITPCWGSITEPQLSTITGGWDEGDDLTCFMTAQRELWEEAGYRVKLEDLVYLGGVRGTKSTDTQYHLFTVDLTGVEQTGDGEGDGSELEAVASNRWVDPKTLAAEALDPMAYVAMVKLNAWRLKGLAEEIVSRGAQV